jgi:hypothetical protein
MKKIMTYLLLCTCLIIVQSCQPETTLVRPDFHILNITYTNASINSCTPSSGGSNGSVFDFALEMDSTVGYGSMPKIRFKGTFENGSIFGPYERTFPNFTYNFTNNTIEDSQCIRFASSNWVDMQYEVFNPAGNVTEAFTVRVNKPAGAN